jgi:adenylyl-sulfate kinase
MADNIYKSKGTVDNRDRNGITGRKSAVFWLFGLSGSGKSAISTKAEQRLFEKGVLCYRLDGDDLRSGLNADLGFSKEDRSENIRRAAEVAKLMADAGLIVISTFITPLEENRKTAAGIIGGYYNGVYIKCNMDNCIKRDPKGLYKMAMKGEIDDFTGVSAPFEEGGDGIFTIDTVENDEDECVDILVGYILKKTEMKNVDKSD